MFVDWMLISSRTQVQYEHPMCWSNWHIIWLLLLTTPVIKAKPMPLMSFHCLFFHPFLFHTWGDNISICLHHQIMKEQRHVSLASDPQVSWTLDQDCTSLDPGSISVFSKFLLVSVTDIESEIFTIFINTHSLNVISKIAIFTVQKRPVLSTSSSYNVLLPA